jgi:hypothetical protein
MMTLKRNLTVVAASIMLSGIVFGMGVANAANRTEVKRIVVEEARDSRVPTALALAVAKVESDFDERALSSAGARGVMQIMPATAKKVFGVTKDKLWNARLNVQLGIDYLEQLHIQYGGHWELALSHYNGGSLQGGRGANARPHGYTRKYVADVMKLYVRFTEQARIWQVAGDAADMDKIKDWTSMPASAVDVIPNDLEKPVGHETSATRPRVTKIVVRRILEPQSSGQFRGGYRSRTIGSNLKKRLIWARRNLDDFASGTAFIRWHSG